MSARVRRKWRKSKKEKKLKITFQKSSKICLKKVIENSLKNHQKSHPKWSQNPWKNHPKWGPKIDAKKERVQGSQGNMPMAPDRLPSVVKMKINNLQNIILHAIYLQKTNWRGQPTDIADENLRKRRAAVDFLCTKLIHEGFSAEKWSQRVFAE